MDARKTTASAVKLQRIPLRKVVPIRPASALVITQLDLAEVELLRQDAAEAARVYRQRVQGIRRALETGASIEPGLRRVEIKTRRALIFGGA